MTWPDPRVRIMSEMLVSLVTWGTAMTDGSLQSHAAQVSLVTTHAPRPGNGNSFTTRKSVKSCQKYLSLIDEAPGSIDELQQKLTTWASNRILDP